MGRTSSLSVEYRESHDGEVWIASVALVVDGEEPFANLAGGGYIGLHPTALSDQKGLTEPSTSPNGVFLYRCECGELGCGAVMARAFRLRGQVLWDHFAAGNQALPNQKDPLPYEDALFFAEEEHERAMNQINDLALSHPM